MTSNVSDMLAKHHQNEQHLLSLQQRTQSLTSGGDRTNTYPQQMNMGATSLQQESYLVQQQLLHQQQQQQLQQEQQQQQQRNINPNDTLSSTSTADQNTLTNNNTSFSKRNSLQNNIPLESMISPSQLHSNGGILNNVNQNILSADSNMNVSIDPNVHINSITNTNPSLTNATTGTAANSAPIVRQYQQNNSLTSTQSRIRTSMQRSRGNQQLDPRSPQVILIPTSAQPTDILAARFSAWRNIIRSILAYLTETASIQDEIVRQQLRLSHAVQFPFFSLDNQHQPSSYEDKATQKFFLPQGNNSIQDLPTILFNYHNKTANSASAASRELTNEVIPRLEDLRRDLLIKIKEIKSLQSDFKNSCIKELQQTKQDLRNFYDSLKDARYSTPKQDPYLTKIVLDKQIKRQISEENFLHEAFDNLETSGAELEKVVVMEIQNALTQYARLLGQQSQIVFDDLIAKLDSGFFNIDPQFEWDNFIARDPNFLLPNLPMRNFKNIIYKAQYDPLTYQIRSGYLERRSKFLKSYSKGYYVLTPSFLHEFKTSDRKKDLVPVMSLSLTECTVQEHSKKNPQEAKFILHAKQNGLIHKGHNWVFKADSYEVMMSWFQDIKVLTTAANLEEKVKFIRQKLNLDADGKPVSGTRTSTMKSQPSRDSTITEANVNANNNENDSPIPRISIQRPT